MPKENTKPFTTRMRRDLWRALLIAGAKTGKPVYQVVEDALLRHPAIKKEMESSADGK